MSFSIEISLDAETDVEEAANWYQERSERAAIEFVRQVRATLDRVAENPEYFGIVYSGLRRARVRKYPYGVFYRIGDQRIDVVAVMHDQRSPATWQDRA